MKKTVRVFKAQPIGDRTVENVTIVIEEEFPDCETLVEHDYNFRMNAVRLERALYYSLPGGTYDQLLGEMLQRRGSDLVVSHGRHNDSEV